MGSETFALEPWVWNLVLGFVLDLDLDLHLEFWIGFGFWNLDLEFGI